MVLMNELREEVIPLFKVYMNPSAKDAVGEVLDSGYIGQGPKVDEFEKYIKDIKKQFPGLQIAYDHPAGYAALKSQNINNFLNITPIANDINIFKGNFVSRFHFKCHIIFFQCISYRKVLNL